MSGGVSKCRELALNETPLPKVTTEPQSGFDNMFVIH